MPTPSEIRGITFRFISAGALWTLAGCATDALVPRRIAQTRPNAAAAMPSPFHPNAEKYADHGAKPSTGRSGSALITSRALLGKDGSTLVEATTGQLDAGTAAPGQIVRVQLKTGAADSPAIHTLNFNTPSGGGYWSTRTTGAVRGESIQLQTDVRGIDPNRTDVVGVADTVKLRPDIAVSGIGAPAQVVSQQVFSVSAVVRELNGDVGARANCRLFVDSTQADEAQGIWVDAAGTVSCAFTASLAATGTHTLEVRATDVTPADWDLSNDTASTTIEVVPARTNVWWYASAFRNHDLESEAGQRTSSICPTSTSCIVQNTTYQESYLYDYSGVWMSTWAPNTGVAFPASVTYDAASGGAIVAQLHAASVRPDAGRPCAFMYDAATSTWGSLCVEASGTSSLVQRFAGTTTYYGEGYTAGSTSYYACDSSSSACAWQTYPYADGWSYNQVFGTPALAFASDVSLWMSVTDANGRTLVAEGHVPLTAYSSSGAWPYCYTDAVNGYQDCGTHDYRNDGTAGWASGGPTE